MRVFAHVRGERLSRRDGDANGLGSGVMDGGEGVHCYWMEKDFPEALVPARKRSRKMGQGRWRVVGRRRLLRGDMVVDYYASSIVGHNTDLEARTAPEEGMGA
jgi:hypothetical protein